MAAEPLLAALALSIMALAASPQAARANADPFAQCIRSLRATREARGIAPATWQTLAGMTPDSAVLTHLGAQPEFQLPVWDYVAVMVDQQRIDVGRRAMLTHAATLDAVARQYAVDASVLAAVWGVESDFGTGVGSFSVLRSLATLSCSGRRQSYFRHELLAALRIVQGKHVTSAQFIGSWAGAFGQTQFMPSSFWSRAVDYDRDGRRDLIHSVGDAIASAANYLRQSGWRNDVPWGIEVRLPNAFDSAHAWAGEGRHVLRPLREWSARGLSRADGSPLVRLPADDSIAAGLFLPAGPSGPALLVTRNFDAVHRYNASERYVLAVLHLADRLRGGAPFVTPWPTADPGLSRVERVELQQLLIKRGHSIGAANGVLGPPTHDAVRAEQHRLRWDEDGRPGQRLLVTLRGEAAGTRP